MRGWSRALPPILLSWDYRMIWPAVQAGGAGAGQACPERRSGRRPSTGLCRVSRVGLRRMHRARNIQEAGMAINFQINGRAARSDAPRATPLLWVIREELKLTGTKFGCGTGLCGACMVHVDDKRAFSCLTQIGEVAGRRVTTIEGLSADS